MGNPKAQAAKEKGNEAFKKGDYPAAIGHYTTALIADRSDATYPLNRAAAYLKLGKNEDAERDCTTVLEISASNVKALFRRGQARIGTGKFIEAQRDFMEALRLEPANGAVRDELKKVAELIEREKQKKLKGPAASVQASLEPAAAAKRRRIPIKIMESPSPETKSNSPKLLQPAHSAATPSSKRASTDTIEQVSSRPLKPAPPSADSETLETPISPVSPAASKPPTPSTATSTPQGTSKPASFKDAKQARDNTKTSRVGGGVFRSSGNNTLFKSRDGSLSPQPSVPSASDPKPEVIIEPRKITETGPLLPDPARALQHVAGKIKPIESEVVPATKGISRTQTTPPIPIVQKRPTPAPATLFEFNREWSFTQSNDEKWDLICSIPPAKFPALCKSSLEPSMLVNILETFLAILKERGNVSEIIQPIKEYMESIARVHRFPTLAMFLSSKEKEVAAQIFNRVGIEYPPGPWTSVVGRGKLY